MPDVLADIHSTKDFFSFITTFLVVVVLICFVESHESDKLTNFVETYCLTSSIYFYKWIVPTAQGSVTRIQLVIRLASICIFVISNDMTVQDAILCRLIFVQQHIVTAIVIISIVTLIIITSPPSRSTNTNIFFSSNSTSLSCMLF